MTLSETGDDKVKPLLLHDALVGFTCKVCGSHLEWDLNISEGLYQPKYTSAHCGFEYEMNIESVTVRVVTLSKNQRKEEQRAKQVIKSNVKAQREQGKVQMEYIPRPISMNKALKEKSGREKKVRTKDNVDEEVKAIKELETHGELKEDVPIGGEEFEDEEPRQGE
jgi:hypothetical protein